MTKKYRLYAAFSVFLPLQLSNFRLSSGGSGAAPGAAAGGWPGTDYVRTLCRSRPAGADGAGAADSAAGGGTPYEQGDCAKIVAVGGDD